MSIEIAFATSFEDVNCSFPDFKHSLKIAAVPFNLPNRLYMDSLCSGLYFLSRSSTHSIVEGWLASNFTIWR